MMKRIFAFILVLALAMSCAFASELDARSATIKVTVSRYKITKEQVLSIAKTSDDPVLATYLVDYKNGQATATAWKVEQSFDGENWTEISYSADPTTDTRIVVNASNIVYDGFATKVQVRTTAYITTPGGEKDTEAVTLEFVIVNDKDEDAEDWSETDDDPADNDNDETDKGGKDEEDERAIEGLLSIDISATKYDTMEGDEVTVTATPVVGSELQNVLGLGIGDVQMTLYMEGIDGLEKKRSTAVVKKGTGSIEIAFETSYIEDMNNISKFWAVGKLTLAASEPNGYDQ